MVVTAAELTATIRMQDDLVATLTLLGRHLHRPDHHLAILSIVH